MRRHLLVVLTLAILLGLSAAALPAQAQTAGKSKTAATKKAPQASSRSALWCIWWPDSHSHVHRCALRWYQ